MKKIEKEQKKKNRKKMPREYAEIINPETKRKIIVGGSVYRKLVRRGIIPEYKPPEKLTNKNIINNSDYIDKNSFLNLPTEIIEKIIIYLDKSSFGKMNCTSWKVYQIVSHPNFLVRYYSTVCLSFTKFFDILELQPTGIYKDMKYKAAHTTLLNLISLNKLPIRYMYLNWISKPLSHPSLEDKDDFINSFRFSHLHQMNMTALTMAIHNDHFKMVEFLLRIGSDINHKECPPLIAACVFGKFRSVKLLLELGANTEIQCPDTYGETPLIIACYRPNSKIIKLLLQFNANTNVINRYGIKPLEYLKLINAINNKKTIAALEKI